MACNKEFIENICDVLSPLGEVKSRKMMGDYVIYVNGKCVITACDNMAYMKKLPCISEIMDGFDCGSPYPGAPEAYILDFTRLPIILKAVRTIWDYLPYPKSRK